MSERSTFSPFWHVVRAARPRLRPHVQITRQHYRGQRWHVLHDPATNQFYRLGPVAYEFVQLLDGRRTAEEVWHISLTRHGDEAPTQNEVIQLVGQLYSSNLLSVEATPEVEQLLRRGRERRKKKVQQQAIGLMYFRVKLINPDRILGWIEPVLRPILNKWGLLAWAALVITALANLLPHWETLKGGFGSSLAPANWGWLAAVFVVVKLIHETGHGVICKRFGGQVPEFGAMMLVLVPAPYVDASASWSFASKWQRIAVGAGGMLFELVVASIAAFLWLNSAEGTLAHQIAYNAMLTSSVSTVLFNANPLMRFDGYYMLSDLIEVPNLMQRSTSMLQFLAQKYLYRVKEASPPTSVPQEQAILVVYGAAALAYRVFVFFSITLYVMGQMFALGLILAVWTAAMWFLLPLGTFINWLSTNPRLAEFRARAVVTTLVLAVAGVGVLGLAPMPDHRRGDGVVESRAKSGVFIVTEGFVESAHVRPGMSVRKGDPIVTCRSPDLENQVLTAEAMVREAEAVERQQRSSPSAKSLVGAQIAAEKVGTLRKQIEFLRTRLDRLIVRAPHDGVIVGQDPERLVGSYVKEGSLVCDVADTSELRVAAAMTQAEASWLFELAPDQFSVEMRTVSRPERVVAGAEVRPVSAGQLELPHAALSAPGGGQVEVDPQDREARKAKRPQFTVYVSPVDALDPAAPGERVRLRFTLPSRPLLAQWVDRVQKLIQGRVHI